MWREVREKVKMTMREQEKRHRGGKKREEGVDEIRRAMTTLMMKAPPPSVFLEGIQVLIPFLTGRS